MPDLLHVFAKKWKLIFTITLLATVIATVAALFSPTRFMSVATALPANSMVADKARIFNQNIEALYSDFGTPDELDRLEGTAVLDTIFIATSNEMKLAEHYSIEASGEGPYKAALELKKNTKINRSGYGELKVKVWDADRNMAAGLANHLLQKLQELHQHLQNESNVLVLAKLKEDYIAKQKEYYTTADSANAAASAPKKELFSRKSTALADQLQQYEKMIDQYQLAINTNAPVLLVVENARPPLWPDKPKILPTVLLAFFAGLLFSFLVALFLDSRKNIS
jgi:capsular polysaccharide biosynthesis protein